MHAAFSTTFSVTGHAKELFHSFSAIVGGLLQRE